MPMKTENQRKLLMYVAVYRQQHGTSPTLREIVDGIGVSDNKALLGIIGALEKQGLLTRRKPRTSRSVQLTERGWQVFMDLSRQVDVVREYESKSKLHPPIQRYDVSSVSMFTPTKEFRWQPLGRITTDGTSNKD